MEKLNYNKLAVKAHQNAVNHGFWEEKNSTEHCLMLIVTKYRKRSKHTEMGKSTTLKHSTSTTVAFLMKNALKDSSKIRLPMKWRTLRFAFSTLPGLGESTLARCSLADISGLLTSSASPKTPLGLSRDFHAPKSRLKSVFNSA